MNSAAEPFGVSPPVLLSERRGLHPHLPPGWLPFCLFFAPAIPALSTLPFILLLLSLCAFLFWGNSKDFLLAFRMGMWYNG
jgi:hypothetical protein